MIPATQLLLKSNSFSAVDTMWRMVDSLYGGTQTMRDAGQEYLPKAEKESNKDYANRLQHSVLMNFYKQAVDQTNDLVYNNGIQVTNSTPTVDNFFDDVNAKGDNLETFMRDAGKSAIHYGISYIVTDYTRTYDDEPSEYDRPYWCLVEAPDMIAIESKMVQGVETICHVRFRETVMRDYSNASATVTGVNGNVITNTVFNTSTVSQVRCYYLNTDDPRNPFVVYQIYQCNQGGETWSVVREGIVEGVIRIPIVPYYGNKTNYYIGRPLYDDLAELNVRHWQSYSDQCNLLHYARFPILFTTGVNDIGPDGNPIEIDIGANTVLRTSNPDADMKFVSHDGKAVESGWGDVDRLEDAMTIFGPTLSVDGKGNGATATEWVLRASALNSTLTSLAQYAENTLSHLMGFTIPYLNEASMPTFLIEPRVLDIPDSNKATPEASTPSAPEGSRTPVENTVNTITNRGSQTLAAAATAEAY